MSLRTVAGFAGLAAVPVLVCDILHVRRTLLAHHDECEAAVKTPDCELELLYPDDLAGADLVSREQFERRLLELDAELELQEEDTRIGIGRTLDSVSFKVNRESAVFLAGGRAALLQVAHPYVAAGVSAHSAMYTRGVQERFYRTFLYVFSMTYGDREEAFRAARAVRTLHQKVEGRLQETVGKFGPKSGYSAHHLDALIWVWATLVESAVLMYGMMVGPLTAEEKSVVVRSGSRFGALFGIPEERIPPDWPSFQAYCAKMWKSDVLKVSAAGRKIESFLFTPPSLVFAPLMRSLQRTARVLLPPSVCVGFYGDRPSSIEKARAYFSLGLCRFLYRLLPPSFRWLSAYVALEERMGRRLVVPPAERL